MMTTAPSAPVDPNQIHFNMSAPPPVSSRSRTFEILKLLIILLIALILGAILVVLIVVPRTSNEVDLRESNEILAKLERESNEKMGRLQRESNENLTRVRYENQMLIEAEREKREEIWRERQEYLTKLRREEDRLIEVERREQDTNRTMEQAKQNLEIEEKRLKLLLEDRQLVEEHRKEDLGRQNAELVSDLMEQVLFPEQPVNRSMIEVKVLSLLRRLDPLHKSILIHDLYQANLLTLQNGENKPLDLRGANLKNLDLDGIDSESGQVGSSRSYTQLALPSTNLINASFEHLSIDEANFSSSDMMGVSFRSSTVHRTDFSYALLSLSNFHSAQISESIFSAATLQRASFESAFLTKTRLDNADLQSSNFQHADLSYSRMDYTSVRKGNFYFIKALQTNFTHAYMADCQFTWANLQYASFRHAFLVGANFENADVQNVDFTRAVLAGANISTGQLDVVLSITNATLPDGSTGKNKNLLKNGNAQCADINDTISDWTTDGNVLTDGNPSSNDCVFQARAVNATMQQTAHLARYRRLVENGEGRVCIEMQDKTTTIVNPSVYMTVRFFDEQNVEIPGEKSSMDISSSTPTPKFSATISCPPNTVQLEVTMVFREVNATVDNIYVTIE